MNPKSIEKIVLPLDGSDLAASAIPWVGMIAGHTRASVDLVSAVDADDEPDMRATLVDHLEKSKSKLESQSSHVSTFAEVGTPPATIADHARQVNAHLIVMASHGHSGAIARILGSVSHWVLRLTEIPVMIVKPDSGTPVVTQILYPLDGGFSIGPGLDLAAGLARDLSIPLSMAHITESAYEAPKKAEQASQELASQGVQVELYVEQGDPRQRITEMVNEHEGTLVVIESATATGIDLGKTGSFAEHLFINTAMPTIVVPKPK